MKVVIISDTHFGDNESTLVNFNGSNVPKLGRNYDKFKEVAGQDNDYLVLLGDSIDFSISDYKSAYDAARVFFKQIKKDGIAKHIIYLPGNHDCHLWHTIEYQTNIINPMVEGRRIRQFRMSVPGVLDDRPDRVGPEFNLPTVTPRSGAGKSYGGLFLDYITGKSAEDQTTFYFAYPNLYLITKDGQVVLLTHGQYFNTFWSLGGKWAPKIFGNKELQTSQPLDLKDLVSLNFPLSQLICSGTGQAGKLTRLIRQIQYDFKKSEAENIEKYLDRLANEIDKLTRYGLQFWKELFTDALLKMAKDKILAMIRDKEKKEPRDNDQFVFDEEVQKRIEEYYASSLMEIEDLNNHYQYNITQNPFCILFGHTHCPVPWGTPDPPVIKPAGSSPRKVYLYNTGGWLHKPDEGDNRKKSGAEVFIYDSVSGFESKRIDVVG